MKNDISGKKLFKVLFYRLFTSDIVTAIINIFLPVYISIRCTYYADNWNWWSKTLFVCAVIIFFNIVSVFAKKSQNKINRNLNVIYKRYNDQCVINEKMANTIYRLNKFISDYLADGKMINNKKVFEKYADFQTVSFTICESIHNMLVSEYGDEIKCEVTIMKCENKKIEMIAYANDDNKMPSSYRKTFSFDDVDIYFVELFKDLNGTISCLPNKKIVNEKFKKIVGSEKREESICQYIGIPIKTNRNEIELLLQIDVAKEKVFGKNQEQMYVFAKNVLYSYAALLHKIYERDLIFNKYYDMIISKQSKI